MLPGSSIGRGTGTKAAATINILLGMWLFITPWVFGEYRNANAWNAWIAGVLIVLVAGVRMGGSERWKSLPWFNVLFGAWVFASPWIYRYTGDTARFVDSLCIGVVVFVLSLSSLGTQDHRTMVQH